MSLMALIYAVTALVGDQSFRLCAERLSAPGFTGGDAFARWAVVFSGASLLISNFWLSKIIEFSAPFLCFLHPPAIVLILRPYSPAARALYCVPQSHMASRTGFKLCPNSVKVYSTLGGTSG